MLAFKGLLKTALVMGAALPVGAALAANADTIFYGGSIITVNDKSPMAEALAVKNGKIVAVGSEAAVLKAEKGDATKLIDLRGRTMTPGFIDGHSHFASALDMANQVNVSAPPAGPASNPDEIITALKAFAAERKFAPGALIAGYGYDDNLMKPLTRDALDAAFPNNPVFVIHVSMHGVVLNSRAFEKFGISAATPTPEGGIIQRKPGSQEPSGLLMETAAFPVLMAKETPTPQQEIDRLKFAQGLYAAAGITTAQEGATLTADLAILKRGAAAGALFIDVVANPYFHELDKTLAANPIGTWGKYDNRLKISGCKVTIDGSPQGKTAAFTTPYLTDGPSGEKNWKGEPGISQADLNALVKKCYDMGAQMLLHGNGDAAIDMALKAHEFAAPGDLSRDRRTVVIHSQFVRRDQLKKFAAYKFVPSMFTEHTFFFGDTHVKNRGATQAAFLSPLKTAFALGLQPTNHTDFNVVPIDQMLVMWTAVNRISRSGAVIGPKERVTPLQALKAITINGAHQYGEEAIKGSLVPGKLADLTILSDNPLKVPTMKIKDIQVLATFKEGRQIHGEDVGSIR